jgi:Protein of unknown function (DUF1176)
MFMMTKIWMSVLVFLLLAFGVAGRSTASSQNKPPGKKTNLTYADRQAWREILKWSQYCEKDFGNHGEDYAGLEFYPLAARKYLVEVECEVAAYQSTKLFLLYDENTSPARSKSVAFKTYSGKTEDSLEETETDTFLGDSAFDEQQKTLTIFYKMSRFGDCGSVSIYSFSTDAPVLIDYRQKLTCDGEGGEDQSNWKRIMPRLNKSPGGR